MLSEWLCVFALLCITISLLCQFSLIRRVTITQTKTLYNLAQGLKRILLKSLSVARCLLHELHDRRTYQNTQ